MVIMSGRKDFCSYTFIFVILYIIYAQSKEINRVKHFEMKST